MALIPQVVDAVGPIQVLGTAPSRTGAAWRPRSCSAPRRAWIGSAFLATEEAGVQDSGGRRSSTATKRDGRLALRPGKTDHLIRSKWTQAFADSGHEALPMPFQSMVSQPVLVAGMIGRRKDIVPGFAGQASA